jgi:hypothetical protein
MKKLLALLLAVTTLLSVTAIAAAAGTDTTYTDLDKAPWATEAILKWSQGDYAILEGDGNGLFSPNSGITELTIDIIVDKLFGNTSKTWADGPTINREDALVKLAKAFSIAPVASPAKLFTDDAAITVAAKPYIYGLAARGFISGTSTSEYILNPKGVFTRAQIVVLVQGIVGEIAFKDISSALANGNTIIAGGLIIRDDKITLSDVTVQGDLFIGGGVGDGNVYLEDVEIAGTLVVYGGGSKSIHVSGKSKIPHVTLAKPTRFDSSGKVTGQAVSLKVEGTGSKVGNVDVTEGRADVQGTIENLNVSSSDSVVTATNATISTITVSAPSATVAVSGESTVTTVTLTEAAQLATFIADNAKITNVSVESSDSKLNLVGETTVATVTVTETASAATVTLSGATIETVSVAAAGSTVNATGTSKVANVNLSETATKTEVVVQGTASVTAVSTKAEGSTILASGTGSIGSTAVEANDIKVVAAGDSKIASVSISKEVTTETVVAAANTKVDNAGTGKATDASGKTVAEAGKSVTSSSDANKGAIADSVAADASKNAPTTVVVDSKLNGDTSAGTTIDSGNTPLSEEPAAKTPATETPSTPSSGGGGYVPSANTDTIASLNTLIDTLQTDSIAQLNALINEATTAWNAKTPEQRTADKTAFITTYATQANTLQNNTQSTLNGYTARLSALGTVGSTRASEVEAEYTRQINEQKARFADLTGQSW